MNVASTHLFAAHIPYLYKLTGMHAQACICVRQRAEDLEEKGSAKKARGSGRMGEAMRQQQCRKAPRGHRAGAEQMGV